MLIRATEVPSAAPPSDAEKETPPAFEYLTEGRPDPFLPFIKPETATVVDPDELVASDTEPLTGMQLFEPGQLTLVAILFSNTKNSMAMVEDVTGKGYILQQGTLIGAKGAVTSITPQEVLITETTRTRAGKELHNTIVMRLKKEGDK